MWMGEPERAFALSNGPGSLGLSCKEDGLALAGVPLLRHNASGYAPRPAAEIRSLIGEAYEIDADVSALMGGLGAVARALNAGDMVRASIAAVHLRLPPLDWHGAVRIAEAHDLLKQYDPNEPRDARGRWTTEGGGADADAPLSDDPANPPGASDPYALPDDWVRLPPGERIDELGDLLEWIANAKPEDEPAIRAEITRIYYDVGDARGGDALNRALSDAVEPGVTQPDREAILRTYEHYTRADPARWHSPVGILWVPGYCTNRWPRSHRRLAPPEAEFGRSAGQREGRESMPSWVTTSHLLFR
jgi:hypothetical protein